MGLGAVADLNGGVVMGNILYNEVPNTRNLSVRLDSERTWNGPNWFAAICRRLFPQKTGFSLHLATGFCERTCYKYASGQTKPSANLICALLHSEEGDEWLAAIMSGSTAKWWNDYQSLRDLGSRYKIELK